MPARRSVADSLLAAFLFFVLAFASGLVFSTLADAQWTLMNPVRKVQQETDSLVFSMGSGTLKLKICSDSVIRVLYSATSSFPAKTDYVVLKQTWPAVKWTTQSTDDEVTLSTSQLKITVAQ